MYGIRIKIINLRINHFAKVQNLVGELEMGRKYQLVCDVTYERALMKTYKKSVLNLVIIQTML